MRFLATPETWRRVQRIAAAQQETLRRIVLRVAQAPVEVESAVASERISLVIQAVAAAMVAPLERAERQTRAVLLTCLGKAGVVTAQALNTRQLRDNALHTLERSRGFYAFTFDETSPEAIAWARAHAAELITSISEDQRESVRRIVVSAFTQKKPPAVIAREIKQVIGLTGPQTSKFMTLLEVNAKQAASYAKQAKAHRARVIARTETLRASNEGQRQAWAQGTQAGLLTGLELREWITTPDDRLCDICAPMDGQVAGLTESFTLPDGSQVGGPPAHPMCRCAQGITTRTR